MAVAALDAMDQRLQVGRAYVAIGPAEGSKLGPPQRVEILTVDETARRYRTKGTRQAADVIAFGCEHMWRPLPTPPPAAWHDGRLVTFDVETTGVDPETARIVTAAIAACGGGKPTEVLTLLADPGVEIPDEAAAIHGVTTDRARAEGRPAFDVIAEILMTLTRYLKPGLPLVIFNARYDLTVLDREARRHGLRPLTERGFPVWVVDPLVIDKQLHRYRKGSRKLDAQAAYYGARLDAAHDASADAIAAARVAWCIGKRGQAIRRTPRSQVEYDELVALQAEWNAVRHDLPRLHEAQAGWAREQALGLAAYFREQGNPDADRVELDWPLVPYREVQ